MTKSQFNHPNSNMLHLGINLVSVSIYRRCPCKTKAERSLVCVAYGIRFKLYHLTTQPITKRLIMIFIHGKLLRTLAYPLMTG